MSSAPDDPKIPAGAAARKRRLTRHLGRPPSQPEPAAANDPRRAGCGPPDVPPHLGGQHGSAALTLEALRAAGEHLRAAAGLLDALAATAGPAPTPADADLALLHLHQRIALARHVLNPGAGR
jgi:hypothetical protein